ncbi:MAG TPA: hypothetical protein VJG31_02605 [Candidatus Nanoarchaeia archaeon]|nr:hypothetical protein [Candidatus Nanoarchaeia archaeon]
MTKALFFDTGPIITLVMSRLVWILPKLKKQFGGKFYITPAVKRELVTRPMDIKRYEFEALEALKLIKDGILEVYDDVPEKEVARLHALANSSFKLDNQNMEVVQSGEIESVVCALDAEAEAMIMDERTMRLFIENNKEMKALLERRFNKTVSIDKENMNNFSKELGGIKIIRSIELIGVAYKMGLLDTYLPTQKDGRQTLVEAVLWAAKYNGAAVTEHEVEEIRDFLLKK